MRDLFNERLDAMNARIEAALPEGVERYVLYDSYETEVKEGIDTVPVDNLDEVAVEGPVTFLLSAEKDFRIATRSDDFDICEVAEKYHFSQVMESPTYLEVAVLANASIMETKDYQYKFFEGVGDTGRKSVAGIPIYYPYLDIISKEMYDLIGERIDSMHATIEAKLPPGATRRVEYCRPSAKSFPTDLHEVAVKGTVVFQVDAIAELPASYSEVVESPTFLDVAVIANEAFAGAPRYIHPYFDGVVRTSNTRADGVPIYRLIVKNTGNTPTEFIPPPWTVRQAAKLCWMFNGSYYRMGKERFYCWPLRLEAFARLFGDKSLNDVTREDIDDFLACHEDDFLACNVDDILPCDEDGSPDFLIPPGWAPSVRCAVQIMLRWVAGVGGAEYKASSVISQLREDH